MKVRCKVIRGYFISWEAMFTEATDFASRLPPDRLINISHSSDNSEGMVCVWYWATDEEDAAFSGAA